jgi:prepilin-type N-terminal cleavage/methylation domain-containing protein
MRKDENMKRITLSNKTRKTLRGSSGGFTLIEVLIALALFTIIAFVFAGGLSTASRAVLIADVRTRAESLARTQMESVKSQNYTAASQSPWQVLYQRIGGIPTGYLICSVNATTTKNETTNCGDTTSPSIIAVAWDSAMNKPASSETTLVIKHDDREVITLEGYKRNPNT